jgi:hypothetical protein
LIDGTITGIFYQPKIISMWSIGLFSKSSLNDLDILGNQFNKYI